MAWVSPTGYIDPSQHWFYDTKAYDESEDRGDAASTYVVGSYLELTHSALSCDKVRIMAGDYYGLSDGNINVDVYYSSAWHNIFSGTITHEVWVEYPIGSTQSVTALRLKANSVDEQFNFIEADFNEAVGGEEKLLTATSSTTFSVTSSLTLGKIEVMTATASASSSILALLIIEYSIQAHAPPVISLTGTLTVSEFKLLSATSASTSSVAGSVSVGKIESLSATAQTNLTIEGSVTLGIIELLTGIVSVGSSTQGILSIFKVLTGAVSVVNSVSASLTLGKISALNALSSIQSVVAGKLNLILVLSAISSVTVVTSGYLSLISLINLLKKLIQLIEIRK